MKTRICDICGRNISDFSLKIKIKDDCSKFIWTRYDMCPVCYKSMTDWIRNHDYQHKAGHEIRTFSEYERW